jgi:hypothetical protein
VTSFFIPGSARAGMDVEEVYAGIREAAQAGTGHPPRSIRIFKLSFRHDGVDLEAEVGKPDPVGGHTVIAILDLGRHSPYLIRCMGGSAMQVLVRKPVYSVTEFSE